MLPLSLLRLSRALPGLMIVAWVVCVSQLPGMDWWSIGLPAGQNYYRFSKFAALAAVLLLALQVYSGLLKTPWQQAGYRVHQQLHMVLGCAVLCCALLHYVTFMWGVNLRQQHFPTFLLMPLPVKDYYSLALLMGWLSLWVLLLMTVSGALRRRFPRVMSWLHRSWLGVGAGVIAHSSMIGGDVQTLVGRGFYAVILLSILFALLMRYVVPTSTFSSLPIRATSV
jgi:hypothetical protein